MSPPPRPFKITSIVIGVLVGHAYGVIARAFDANLVEGGTVTQYHRAFDLAAPLLFGLSIGVAVSYAQYRSFKAEWADRRSEELRQRLAGTEQNQAVWVLASSLLHELRNPLHTVGLALAELSKRTADPASNVLVRQAEAAVNGMTHKFVRLRELANGPAADNKRYRLDRVLGVLRDELAPVAKHAKVELDVACDEIELNGDAAFVSSAIENLVSNAVDSIASSGVGHRVSIRASSTPADTLIVVEDDGPGLADEVRECIFEPLRSTKSPSHGLGLGLPIARAMIRAGGGDVRLSCAERGHTAFELRLPHSRSGA